MTATNLQFGYQDHSYRAAEELEGITKLVDDFYQVMDSLPRAKRIRDMHPKNLVISRDKLTLFYVLGSVALDCFQSNMARLAFLKYILI